MCCSNLGAIFRSQYLSHMMRNLGGVLDKVTVVHNLTGWSWKNSCAHFACSMQKGKSPKMTSCGPSNIEGDLLPKPKFLAHLSST